MIIRTAAAAAVSFAETAQQPAARNRFLYLSNSHFITHIPNYSNFDVEQEKYILINAHKCVRGPGFAHTIAARNGCGCWVF
jgi:hypothetical protein